MFRLYRKLVIGFRPLFRQRLLVLGHAHPPCGVFYRIVVTAHTRSSIHTLNYVEDIAFTDYVGRQRRPPYNFAGKVSFSQRPEIGTGSRESYRQEQPFFALSVLHGMFVLTKTPEFAKKACIYFTELDVGGFSSIPGRVLEDLRAQKLQNVGQIQVIE